MSGQWGRRGMVEVKGTVVKNQWLLFPRVAQTRHTSLGLGISRKVTGTLGRRDGSDTRGEVMDCVQTCEGQAAESPPTCTDLSMVLDTQCSQEHVVRKMC